MKIADIERQAAELETESNKRRALITSQIAETEAQKAKLLKLASEQGQNMEFNAYAKSMAEIRNCDDILALCKKNSSMTSAQQNEVRNKMESMIADANKAFRKESASDWADILKYVNKAYEAEMSLRQKQTRTVQALQKANTAYGNVPGVSMIDPIPVNYSILNMIDNLKRSLEEREKNEKKGNI